MGVVVWNDWPCQWCDQWQIGIQWPLQYVMLMQTVIFPTDTGGASQSPYIEGTLWSPQKLYTYRGGFAHTVGASQSPYAEGIVKAPWALCAHICTFLSFFPTDMERVVGWGTSIIFLLGIVWNVQKCMENHVSIPLSHRCGVRVVGKVPKKLYLAMQICTKIHASNPQPYGVGGPVPKFFFARNPIKCADLHTKNMIINPKYFG